MEFQVGDFVEIFYRANNHTCHGEVLSVLPYQLTLFVCYANGKTLKGQVGHELRLNLDPANNHIVIRKWEPFLSEEDLLSLMHVALQTDDKAWFEELGNQKKQVI